MKLIRSKLVFSLLIALSLTAPNSIEVLASSDNNSGPEFNQLSSDEFLKTKASQYFMNAEYEKALSEFRKLEAAYPKNILIRRYIGLTLDKLGKYDDAFNIYDQTLRENPENIPLHYSLAQLFLHQQNFVAAKREFQYVADNDQEGFYRARAVKEVAGIESLIKRLNRAKPRKWTFGISTGAEYNTNATSESRVPEFGIQEEQAAWKFSSAASGSYEFFKKGAWSAKGVYTYYQAFYSNSLSQINLIANSPGINITYFRLLYDKPIILQFGHVTSYVLVRDNFYANTYSQYVTALYSPTDWYRVAISERLSANAFAKDGLEPDITSRDGIGNTISWSNNFYMNPKKTAYYMLGFEYQRDDTQGVNYIKNSVSAKTGFHFPILTICESEITFRFKESEFPKYSPINTLPERGHEEEYNLEVGLNKKLNERWSLSAGYKLTMTDSQNDLYTYTNNALGANVSYNY